MGAANQRHLEIDWLSDDAWASASGAMGQQLASKHAAELERRTAMAGARQQWSSQQQALGPDEPADDDERPPVRR